MSNLFQTFSLDSMPVNERTGSFDPLPTGWYSASIAGAEVKQTKAGGDMISVKYQITGPNHAGRVIFGNFNIRNANERAQEIGQQQLGELMKAIGLDRLSDTDQLIGGVCDIKLDIRKSAEYGDSNDVKAWKASAGVQQPSAAASGVSGNAPWHKK